jgi:hypothetical protein
VIPIPVPDYCVGEFCRRMVIGPPSGDLTDDTCRAVEAVVGLVDDRPRIAVLVALEAGELERLNAMSTPAVWLTVMADHLVPFALHVADAEDWPDSAGG